MQPTYPTTSRCEEYANKITTIQRKKPAPLGVNRILGVHTVISPQTDRQQGSGLRPASVRLWYRKMVNKKRMLKLNAATHMHACTEAIKLPSFLLISVQSQWTCHTIKTSPSHVHAHTHTHTQTHIHTHTHTHTHTSSTHIHAHTHAHVYETHPFPSCSEEDMFLDIHTTLHILLPFPPTRLLAKGHHNTCPNSA